MSKPKSIVDDLRARLGDAEGREQELIAERDTDVSYMALVERDKTSVARLAEINDALGRTKNEIAALRSAMQEAVNRERAAEDASLVARRRADAERAKSMLGELEQLGIEFDASAIATVKAATAIRSKVSELRELTDAGPSVDSVQVNLKRALAAATMGGPLHTVHLAPADRVTLSQLVGPWLQSFRNRINAVLGDKPAKAA